MADLIAPKEWHRTKRRAWEARWGHVNDVGKVDRYEDTPVDPRNVAAANDSPIVYGKVAEVAPGRRRRRRRVKVAEVAPEVAPSRRRRRRRRG